MKKTWNFGVSYGALLNAVMYYSYFVFLRTSAEPFTNFFLQVIVQIVDARNPLLFRCEDLERYVLETSREKMNLILINKADFLSEKQREAWARYFNAIDLPIAFFSALQENQNHQMKKMAIEEEEEEPCDEEEESCDEEEELCDEEEDENDYEDCDSNESEEVESVLKDQSTKVSVTKAESKELVDAGLLEETQSKTLGQRKNSTQLLSRDELIELFKTIHKGSKVQDGRTVVGLVGYPNVGKSSTLNSLLTYKKVSVSATPGKTKHFQVGFFFSIYIMP
jgi:large subunit GTPase 1